MSNPVWRQLARVQTQLEQLASELAELTRRHTEPTCDCFFCQDLQQASAEVMDAVGLLAQAVTAEQEVACDE